MCKRSKYILSVISLVLLYIVLSIGLSKDHRFVNNKKIMSIPKEKSIENNTFLELAQPKIIYLNKIENEFYVYKFLFCYYKSYGLLNIFEHKVINKKQCYYKFEFNKVLSSDELSNYIIIYNNEKYTLFDDFEGYNSFKDEIVEVELYYKDSLLLKAIY